MRSEDEAVGRYVPVEMTAGEYERQVARLFWAWARTFEDLRIQHGERVKGVDGEYVIDTTIRFRAFGKAEFLVLVEAKRTGRPIERGEAQKLLQIVQSTGAHKGILVSAAGFQRGALEFARAHGLALVQFVDGAALFETKALDVPGPRPGSKGIAALNVYETPSGYGFTTLTAQPGYTRDILPSLASASRPEASG